MATKYLKGECSHCRGHIEFPVEATGMTSTCPHCGQTTDLLLITPEPAPAFSKRVIVWTSVAVLIMVCGLVLAFVALRHAERWAASKREAAVAQTPAQPSSAPVETQPVAEPDDPLAQAGFKASPVQIVKTKGSSLVYAVGTLTNTGSKTRYGVKVQLDLFDDAEKKVGIASDYQQTMEAGAQWQFRAPVLAKKAAKAKVATVTEQQ